jgi:predicted RNA-binding protein with PUA-like domain
MCSRMLARRCGTVFRGWGSLVHCWCGRKGQLPTTIPPACDQHSNQARNVQAALLELTRSQRREVSLSKIAPVDCCRVGVPYIGRAEACQRQSYLHSAASTDSSPITHKNQALESSLSPSTSQMTAYWLLKSEPEEWSWDNQVSKGEESWDGVRNPLAQKHMRAMKCGDLCFFYHSGKEKAVVGIVSVSKEFYPDPSDASGKWMMVDVKAVKPLVQPVTLAVIKADPIFADLVLVRQPRLSVVPLEKKHWERIIVLGSKKREEAPKQRKPRKGSKKEKLDAVGGGADGGARPEEGTVVVESRKVSGPKAAAEASGTEYKGRLKARKPSKEKQVESVEKPLKSTPGKVKKVLKRRRAGPEEGREKIEVGIELDVEQEVRTEELTAQTLVTGREEVSKRRSRRLTATQ